MSGNVTPTVPGIFHEFFNTKPEGPDPDKTNRSNWNQKHVLGPGTFLIVSDENGLGIDGDITFDGTSTVLGMTPDASHVYSLAGFGRDLHGKNITFTGLASLFTANWRVFSQGQILGAGSGTTKIFGDGASASGSTPGGLTAAGFYAASLAGGSAGVGTSVGSAPLGNNTAPPIYSAGLSGGGTGSASTVSAGGDGSTYLRGGGGGGAQTTNTGGQLAGFSGGNSALIAITPASGGYGPREMDTLHSVNASTVYNIAGAGGGGGVITSTSGTTIANASGGAGGAGGTRVYVAAQSIKGVTISSRGGNGGNAVAAAGGSPRSAAGGGGGGPGGEVVVKSSTYSDVICDVTGGASGTGAASGPSCTGAIGGVGFKGRVFWYNLAGDLTSPTVVP